ncbi:MAG: hypothetical protein U0992_23355 [Planctomycetaceae bacterium]
MIHTVRTDKDGRFEFTRLPPGSGSIRSYLGLWRESPLTSSESVVLNLQPGEHRELVLGGNGIIVTGQVNATGRGDVELNKNWSLNYLVRRDALEPAGRFPQAQFRSVRPGRVGLVPRSALLRLVGNALRTTS